MESKNELFVQKDIHQVSTKWEGKMHFSTLVNQHIIHVDKQTIHGGDDLGPRPKPLMLSAIGGCTGMEIISILDKMRLKIEAIEIDVTGELTNEHPKFYKTIHIRFMVKCEADDKIKIEKAIRLAVDKYCGVVAMMRKFAAVTDEIKYL